MPGNNRKVLDNLVSRTKIYLAIILILLIVICIFNTKFIIPSILIYILILGYSYFTNNKRKSEISEHLQDLTLTVDSAAKSTLINSPFPLIIIETDGNVVWRSSRFISEFQNIDIIRYVNDFIIDAKDEIEKRENKRDKSIKGEILIGKKTYKIVGGFTKAKSKSNDRKKQKEYMMMLYFLDKTEDKKLLKQFEDSQMCVGIIMVDNYEDVIQRIEIDKRPGVIAKIEKNIYEIANDSNGLVIKTDRDRFVYVFEYKYLEKLKEDKFSILDTMKEIELQGNMQLTLSIAVSNEGKTPKEKYESALGAMDVVLGRGGDQAVIRENAKYNFFGGRAEEVEKRTKVKARIVAHALENLIKESEQVIIMGHTNPDIDSMGSSLGVYRLAKSLEKDAYVVNNTNGLTLQSFLDTLLKDEEYKECIITAEEAENKMTDDTLLVIVDTHKKTYVEAPNLLEKNAKIVIIDHHRRSADYIEQSTLMFQEVYASSAAELVTELLQYTECKPKLRTLEAESLYAGIMMDTKNFTFKTGVRTFEAAAYLRKCGVDIIKVKKWFQSDLESFNKIAEIVKNAEIVNDTIGISVYKQEDKDAGLICAKAADELLTISDITASFVIGNMGDKINISGRSIGDINVQIILEKLGGGGHITLAGAQLENMTLEEAKQELLNRINEYFSEMSN